MSPTTTVDGTSLRERKKQRTRDALIDAAFELFSTKGFEATTVDEIADSVEVSSRTFFRYFGSKEDVATSIQLQQFLDVYRALEARPAGEPVVTAMRHAVVDVLRAYEEGGTDAFQFACVMQLVQESPAVMARSLEMCTEQLDELARHVAVRMGVDPVTDPRPKLVAAVASAALQVAVRAWREDEPDEKVSDLADRAFALLEAGINYPAAP
jgi:AcrR family transcriptional regulator